MFGRAATAMGGASNENERNEDGKITPGASVGKYEFSYCDEDVLIGKATGSQGIFIFTKRGGSIRTIVRSTSSSNNSSSIDAQRKRIQRYFPCFHYIVYDLALQT